MSGAATWEEKGSDGGGEWAGLPVPSPHHMTCIHAQCGSPTAHAVTVTHIYRVPAPLHRPGSPAPGEGGSGGSAWGSWTLQWLLPALWTFLPTKVGLVRAGHWGDGSMGGRSCR